MTKTAVIISIDAQRSLISSLDHTILAAKAEIALVAKGSDCGEAIANIMLAHRCLEDARMRLGKVIQALEGGVSIFDHPKVQALIEEIRASG